MFTRTRTRARTSIGIAAALLALLVGPAAATAHDTAPKGASATGDAPPSITFSGSGTYDVRVVIYAAGDHVHFGTCSGDNPVGLLQSWSAALVALPGSMLSGTTECGRQVRVTNEYGISATATVVGKCSTCTGSDIALSPALFKQLAPAGKGSGSINVTWQFTG